MKRKEGKREDVDGGERVKGNEGEGRGSEASEEQGRYRKWRKCGGVLLDVMINRKQVRDSKLIIANQRSNLV